MSQELSKQEFTYQITSLDQAMTYAKMISESDLAPKDYRNKPGNVLIAMQFGSEIGLKPLQAIQNIAVINGRPSLWGDAMMALVLSHPVCEYVHEHSENGTAYCAVKRKDEDKEYVYTFSKEDAKIAGLLNKPGCWTQYPERMLQMRARGFALRDKFADVLKGIAIREEVQDYVVDITPAENKNKAASLLDNLLEDKNKPRVIFEDLCCMMNEASSLEELDRAAEHAKHLSDEDKEKARSIYKKKYHSFLNTLTGEITQDGTQ
jgi:hypothetical protein